MDQRARDEFLATLATGLSVTASYIKAGLPRSTVYTWRKNEPEFAEAWDEAIEVGGDILEDEAFRRACHGTPEPLTSQGKLVREAGEIVTVQKYSDTLMTLLLKAKKPEKFRERVSQAVDVNVAADAPVLSPDEPLPETPIL